MFYESLDPEAEVVALSPKTLMATSRYVCEICNKGFQRDQNLQLHRRGHNLPWKLKQKSARAGEAKKKVYLSEISVLTLTQIKQQTKIYVHHVLC
jgi:Zinc-finger double-stranded RNA-binding